MLPRISRGWLFMPCLVLLVVGIGSLDRYIARCLLPLYEQVLHLMAPDVWSVSPLQVVQEGRETFFSLGVVIQTTFPMNGCRIPAGLKMNGSTLVGHSLQPLSLMLTMLFVWLLRKPGRRIGPTILMLPALLLVETIDVPFVLTGSLWDILHANFVPNAPLPWQVRIMVLMNSGGRQALSLAAAITAITLGCRLQAWWPWPARDKDASMCPTG